MKLLLTLLYCYSASAALQATLPGNARAFYDFASNFQVCVPGGIPAWSSAAMTDSNGNVVDSLLDIRDGAASCVSLLMTPNHSPTTQYQIRILQGPSVYASTPNFNVFPLPFKFVFAMTNIVPTSSSNGVVGVYLQNMQYPSQPNVAAGANDQVLFVGYVGNTLTGETTTKILPASWTTQQLISLSVFFTKSRFFSIYFLPGAFPGQQILFKQSFQTASADLGSQWSAI